MYNYPYHSQTQRENNQTPQSSGKKKLKYILSIGKKHIAFFVVTIFIIFGLIFLLGIFAGYSIGKNSQPQNHLASTPEETDLDNYNRFNPTSVSQNVSNSLKDNEFVSEQVTIDEDFHNEDVLKVGGKNSNVEIQPLEKKSQKNVSSPVKPAQTVKKATAARPYVNQPVPGVLYYYIQVIATLDVTRAKTIYDRLKVRDYPVKVKKSNKDGQFLYAVRVGLYKNKKLAQRHLRLIRKGGGYTSAFMKSYQIEETP